MTEATKKEKKEVVEKKEKEAVEKVYIVKLITEETVVFKGVEEKRCLQTTDTVMKMDLMPDPSSGRVVAIPTFNWVPGIKVNDVEFSKERHILYFQEAPAALAAFYEKLVAPAPSPIITATPEEAARAKAGADALKQLSGK